ncbi:polysaccharide deacetylase family protein [Anaerocolumna sp.]|uniref:polysaccharide deacetylase family protein n=1 Tax=Anaerocolumna sp. TaxID=2041569 RepID=UPI0028A5A2D0|nr:polysaccharide deacetylase family protein [Anaerocolumna sp.]
MEIDNEDKEKLRFFIKTGIVVLSFLVICAFGIKYIPKAISVTSVANARELPIYCVDSPEKKVALSFDAAWGNEDTAEILNILEKNNVKVTFFMTGGWIEKYPDDVKAIAAAGHDLGNHSENHKHMSQLSKEQSIEEIMKPHNKVKQLTGIDMNLFRPPYGDYNNTLIQATREAGYHCIQWDVDSLDWRDYGVKSIVNTVVDHEHLGNGSIILCHNGAKYTKDALESMITGLKEKGYEIVPISQLIYTSEYYMDHEGRQFEK